MNAPLPHPKADAAVLHWAKGGVASFDDFAPQETPLDPDAKVRLQPGDGRSSNEVLPFFSVATPKKDGSAITRNTISGSAASDGIFVASPGSPNTGAHAISQNTNRGLGPPVLIDTANHLDWSFQSS